MTKKPSLREQLIGAAVGTAVALGIYGAYSVAAPAVRGMLASTVSAEEKAPSKFTDADRAARMEEIAERARRMIEQETGGKNE
jgi:hypothetical protein